MSLALNTFLQQLPNKRPLWLALSGGLDSMVLLHLLGASGVSFKAIHVNHQLSPHAHRWQAHCQSACDHLGVELEVKVVDVERSGRGLEDAARQARFSAFGKVLTQGSVLMTAHHCDDQAETFLLRLLRGAGAHGLRGMLPLSPLVVEGRTLGTISRPLLSYSRADLDVYAREHGLAWVDDESNADISLDRNYLRHRVLPSIAKRWQGFAERWRAAANHLTEAAELLDELAQQDLQELVVAPAPTRLGASLPLTFLHKLSAPRAKNLLRYWLAGLGLNPSSAQLAQLIAQLRYAKADAQVNFQVGDASLRRYQGQVFWVPELSVAPTEAIALAPNQSLQFGAGVITMKAAAYGLALPASGKWLVRTRREGERSHPCGRAHSQTLKKLLQEVNLPPWLRDQLPLLCDGQALLAVGDLWLEQSAGALTPNGYMLSWEFAQNSPSSVEAD